MRPLAVIRAALAALILLLVVGLAAPLAAGAAEDWDVPGGHFYTQTGSGGGRGYLVSDDGDIRFWTEFQRFGGVATLGYPASQRFEWDGFTVQVFQRVIFQWRPDTRSVAFVNVFDRLHDLGKDEWLQRVRQTPPPRHWDEVGLSWDQIVARRLAVLDTWPALKAAYFGVPGDPIQMNGLPVSVVVDQGNHLALRAQRVVLQQWKEDVPWARRGQVTVALGGDIAKESGILPNAAALASITPPSAPPGSAVGPAAPPAVRFVSVGGMAMAEYEGYAVGLFAQPDVDRPTATAFGQAADLGWPQVLAALGNPAVPPPAIYLFVNADERVRGLVHIGRLVPWLAERSRLAPASSSSAGIFIDSQAKGSMAERVATLVHEATHHVVRYLARDDPGDAPVPTWYNEGLAVYFEVTVPVDRYARERQATSNRYRRIVARATSDAGRQPLFQLAEISTQAQWLAHYEDDEARAVQYALSYVAIDRLVRQHGLDSVLGLLDDLRRGQRFDAAFARRFGQSVSSFDEELRQSLAAGALTMEALPRRQFSVLSRGVQADRQPHAIMAWEEPSGERWPGANQWAGSSAGLSESAAVSRRSLGPGRTGTADERR